MRLRSLLVFALAASGWIPGCDSESVCPSDAPGCLCPSGDAPVCGCDGNVYGNACAAQSAGVDLCGFACTAAVTPAGYLPCGEDYCDPTVSYCLVGEGDTNDYRWWCKPLPAACEPTAPDCACLTEVLPSEYEAPECTVVEGNGVSGLEVRFVMM